jgi:glycosyltransferase involved in cell wall biosynthesis
LRRGFAEARGDIIIALDADGSTNPEEIPAFIGMLLAGADFVKGSRFLQGGGTADMPRIRQWGNAALTRLVRWLFGGRYTDLCYGYNAFWSSVLPRLQLDADGFEIETLMNIRALRAGLKVAEVASFEETRLHGKAKLRALPDGWRVAKTILRERLHTLPTQPQPPFPQPETRA